MGTKPANNRDLISNSWKTVMEMLEDRQIVFKRIDPHILGDIIDKSSCKPGFSVTLDVISDRHSEGVKGKKIKVVYYMSNKFKLAEIKELYKEKQDFYLNILIVMDSISITNQKMITNLNRDIQFFPIKTIYSNPSHHCLQPRFRLIDDPNLVAELFKTYSVKKNQLPQISKTDVMAKYYGLKPGDIIEITRRSETSGEHKLYRHCC